MKPNLVLIPGFGSDERLWVHQIEHLSNLVNIQVIVLKEQNNRRAMTEYVLSHAPETFILAGHSLGGWVAQAVASEADQRVQKLILVSTWTRYQEGLVKAHQDLQTLMISQPIAPWLEDNFSNCIAPERSTDTAFRESILKMQLEFPVKAYLNQSRSMVSDSETLPLLKLISCPTLVICGRQDAFFAVEEAQLITEKIPNAWMTIIEGCGHMIPMEQPQATTALFRLWLNLNL